MIGFQVERDWSPSAARIFEAISRVASIISSPSSASTLRLSRPSVVPALMSTAATLMTA